MAVGHADEYVLNPFLGIPAEPVYLSVTNEHLKLLDIHARLFVVDYLRPISDLSIFHREREDVINAVQHFADFNFLGCKG